MSTAVDFQQLLDVVHGQQALVVRALEDTTDATQRGVLQAGDVLGTVVAERQRTATSLQEGLHAIEDKHAPQIRRAVATQGELAEAYITETKPLWDETLSLVSDALECARQISQCAARVAQVSKAMGILQMCCKSEIAHLGEAAVSFESTVAEMNSLTRSTDDLNRRLERLSKELSAELPPIANLASAERRRARSFSKAVGQSLDSVQVAAEALVGAVAASLEEVRQQDVELTAASYRALSALQFQDPLVQDMQRVDSRLGELADRLKGREPAENSFLTFKANVGDTAQPEQDEDSLDSGEFLLF